MKLNLELIPLEQAFILGFGISSRSWRCSFLFWLSLLTVGLASPHGDRHVLFLQAGFCTRCSGSFFRRCFSPRPGSVLTFLFGFFFW